MVAWVLLQHENEGQDKRVESVWFPCADEGSTPSSSTKKIEGVSFLRHPLYFLFLYQPVLHMFPGAAALEVELNIVQRVAYFLERRLWVEAWIAIG